MEFQIRKALVLGASGYIGSRLVKALIDQGFSVRAAGRSIASLNKNSWAQDQSVELASVNVLDGASLKLACAGCDAAYYLVHSMNNDTADFAKADRLAAENMVLAAEQSGLKRIIYMGGLGEENAVLSKHLRSRIEVMNILHAGQVPVTTLRAAMVIGSGSVSFEILRALVNRLPIMITPRWISTESQPIAIDNVINYLVGCLLEPKTTGQIYDVGGLDIISYRRLMDIYAEEARMMKRWIIPVPVLTPWLSSHWIQLVTSFPASIARPLAEGLCNRVVCQDHRIENIIPQKLLNCREAIRAAVNP